MRRWDGGNRGRWHREWKGTCMTAPIPRPNMSRLCWRSAFGIFAGHLSRLPSLSTPERTIGKYRAHPLFGVSNERNVRSKKYIRAGRSARWDWDFFVRRRAECLSICQSSLDGACSAASSMCHERIRHRRETVSAGFSFIRHLLIRYLLLLSLNIF